MKKSNSLVNAKTVLFVHHRQGEDADDYVMGVGPSSILLGSLAPRVPGRALELASGIGWLVSCQAIF